MKVTIEEAMSKLDPKRIDRMAKQIESAIGRIMSEEITKYGMSKSVDGEQVCGSDEILSVGMCTCIAALRAYSIFSVKPLSVLSDDLTIVEFKGIIGALLTTSKGTLDITFKGMEAAADRIINDLRGVRGAMKRS